MSKPETLRNSIKIDFSNKHFDSFFESVILATRTKDKTYLLFEGPYDIKVIGRFFNKKICLIACTGRGNVVKVIKKMSHTIVNVIGIADRDYDMVLYTDSRLFYYDDNNFEMMLIKQDNIFDDIKLFAKYATRKIKYKSELKDTRNKILYSLEPVSIFRFVNQCYVPENDRTAVESILPVLSLCLVSSRQHISNLFKTHFNSITTLDNSTKAFIIQKYDEELNKGNDLYKITRGHDFANLFMKELGIVDEQSFYNLFENAFNRQLFENTILFENLKKYSLIQMIDLFSN